MVNASSGRSALAMRCSSARAAGRSPCFARRIATASAVLMRGLAAKPVGRLARQVGHCLLPLAVHLPKQARQKLCWQGACEPHRQARQLGGDARRSEAAGWRLLRGKQGSP